MLIVYIDLGTGWDPIMHMVKLAARLLNAELLILEPLKPNKLQKLEFLLSHRSKAPHLDSCLLITPGPSGLWCLPFIENWNKRFSFLSAWVIDSFWINDIPKIATYRRHFDHIFITSEEDIPEWSRILKTPVTWLPWGSDVLQLGSDNGDRAWDLTRIGRQPIEWDNDDNTRTLCEAKNIHFHGRLPPENDPIKNQLNLTALYKQTKFLLAFSNKVNQTNYTHKQREYLTARWTDALACGATIAGIPPKEPSIMNLLWDGATLDLGTTDIAPGLDKIANALTHWTPDHAQKNYRMALERLDWRWRFAEIAKVHQIAPRPLEDDLQAIRHILNLKTD